ncbi:MAG TPA: fumarylacetoacetate hydrolase family protein [Vicinamibacterales bacterium]|nr:fumarylacetoacetate hydrolase family protein [Vicinamibacterales bacterium]
MKIYRVDFRGGERYLIEREGRFTLLEGDVFGDFGSGEEVGAGEGASQLPAGARLLTPVQPSKIMAIGLNYRDHAAEQKKPLPPEPLVFLKAPSALLAPGEAIRLPAGVGRVDFESELAVVIGRRATKVPRAEARRHVLGYTCMNDVTARDLQNRGVQYSHCKGYDTFAPLGPCIAVGLDPGSLRIQGWQNGELRHDSSTNQLIFPVDQLIEYVSAIMTLLPGDIISTGTPSGIGSLRSGDVFTVRVEGIGDLSNPVAAA